MGLSSWLLGLVCEEQAEEHERHYEKKKKIIVFLKFFFKNFLRWLFKKIKMLMWYLKKAK